jgi:hypothetical protein
MARYIDAEKVIEKISHITVTVMGGRSCEKTIFGKALNSYREEVLKRIEDAPTADVVPKSEVEARGASFYFNLEEAEKRGRQLMREHDAELAREIIADMRELINGYENIDVYLDRIEKKYTEEPE